MRFGFGFGGGVAGATAAAARARAGSRPRASSRRPRARRTRAASPRSPPPSSCASSAAAPRPAAAARAAAARPGAARGRRGSARQSAHVRRCARTPRPRSTRPSPSESIRRTSSQAISRPSRQLKSALRASKIACLTAAVESSSTAPISAWLSPLSSRRTSAARWRSGRSARSSCSAAAPRARRPGPRARPVSGDVVELRRLAPPAQDRDRLVVGDPEQPRLAGRSRAARPAARRTPASSCSAARPARPPRGAGSSGSSGRAPGDGARRRPRTPRRRHAPRASAGCPRGGAGVWRDRGHVARILNVMGVRRSYPTLREFARCLAMAPRRATIVALLERALTAPTPTASLRALTALRERAGRSSSARRWPARCEGQTFTAIARPLGISRQAAHRRYRDLANAPAGRHALARGARRAGPRARGGRAPRLASASTASTCCSRWPTAARWRSTSSRAPQLRRRPRSTRPPRPGCTRRCTRDCCARRGHARGSTICCAPRSRTRTAARLLDRLGVGTAAAAHSSSFLTVPMLRTVAVPAIPGLPSAFISCSPACRRGTTRRARACWRAKLVGAQVLASSSAEAPACPSRKTTK